MATTRSMDDDDELLLLQHVEMSDDSADEEYEYNAVEELDDDDDDDDDTFPLKQVKRNNNNSTTAAMVTPALSPEEDDTKKASTLVVPSVVDDFIRNYFIKHNLTRSLDAFNTEFYEKMSNNNNNDAVVSNVYLKNQQLEEDLSSLTAQLKKMEKVTKTAKGTWDKFRKERDFHRMHHQRVVQEKNKLVTDIKRLKKHYLAYEPTIKALKQKYEVAMKEKMMMKLERDRFKLKASSSSVSLQDDSTTSSNTSTTSSAVKKKTTVIPFPSGPVTVSSNTKSANVEKLCKASAPAISFKGHVASISALAFHPHRDDLIATVSDDETWKLWSIKNNTTPSLVMTGEGHTSWLSSCDFNPSNSSNVNLVTTSGDNSIKLWSFKSASCVTTLREHSHPVWCAKFHEKGNFIISASMDHVGKIWDITTSKCRMTLRGHVDSVNAITYASFDTSVVCTASGDKTVSLWDVRSGLCTQTLYGHVNAVNSVSFMNTADYTLASVDADGIIKLWDARMVSELSTMDGGESSLNSVAFEMSSSGASVVAAGSDDKTVKLFDPNAYEVLESNLYHEDAVQSVVFDPHGRYLGSTSSDGTFKLWDL